MRLIDTSTLELKEFYGDDIPPYAILSHTWGDDESTFQDWSDLVTAQRKAGFGKIRDSCRQAFLDGHRYMWVDTNCIDKTSSTELSEAINSMFKWYSKSDVCYAYISDVRTADTIPEDLVAELEESRWFTRGWTLQELLAPDKVVFYARDWTRIGPLDFVVDPVSQATGIEADYLTGRLLVSEASVAEKMSWLSRRTTSRVEDIAYCMLGLFDINMPLLYGEGINAFSRLQEEIIKFSNDHTIFCWTWDASTPFDWGSMLAPSPSVFRDSANYISKPSDDKVSTYFMTNAGLSIRLPVLPTWSYFFAILEVGDRRFSRSRGVLVPIKQVTASGVFQRLAFPRSPLSLHPLLVEKMAACELDLITRYQGVPTRLSDPYPDGQDYDLLRTKGYALLVTFENIPVIPSSEKHLLLSRSGNSQTRYYDNLVSNEQEKIRLETYPPHMFNFTHSLFTFDSFYDNRSFDMNFPFIQSAMLTSRRRISSGLLRLKSSSQAGCIIFLALTSSSPVQYYWFCKLLTEDYWGTDEDDTHRQLLLADLNARVLSCHFDWETDVHEELNLWASITKRINYMHGIFVRMLHISLNEPEFISTEEDQTREMIDAPFDTDVDMFMGG